MKDWDRYKYYGYTTNDLKSAYYPNFNTKLGKLNKIELMEDINMSKRDMHIQICKELTDIYTRKNHDYGSSYGNTRKKYSDAIMIRLSDKFYRLETLFRGAKAQVSDESIVDTLMDMANYCIMEIIEMRSENEKTNKNIDSSLDCEKAVGSESTLNNKLKDENPDNKEQNKKDHDIFTSDDYEETLKILSALGDLNFGEEALKDAKEKLQVLDQELKTFLNLFGED